MSQDDVYKAVDELGEHFADANTNHGLDQETYEEAAEVFDNIVSQEDSGAGSENN